jgi:hypothetical protein
MRRGDLLMSRFSKRAKARTGLVPGLVIVLVLALTSLGQAVHNEGLFELDRNAVDQGAAGDDWDTLMTGSGGRSTRPTFRSSTVTTPNTPRT